MRDGMRKIDRWTAQRGVATAEFEIARYDPFFNVNTPQELAEAEHIFSSLQA